ncbi:MAG: ATP-binding protein [Lachnospiraceae bacterium]|nr:ATP-binding protein [Lachnospiraceae bacterium]
MQYLHRTLERKFLKMNHVFKVVMVTGARQVGKSTMLQQLAEGSGRTYVTLDDSENRALANTDPGLFFQAYRPPLLIDEIQKAPPLFERMKIICDQSEERGLFWVTGSQSKKLLKEAGDTLAGRLGILKLYSFSQSEKHNISELYPLQFSLSALQERLSAIPQKNIREVYSDIWRGGMPDAQSLDAEELRTYFNSYLETYLLRDATDDEGITDTEGFLRLLRACAACAGQLLNYSTLAEVAGISVPTAHAWVDALCRMGILYLLEPYYNNALKRMVKTPKLYFCDTGLCAYLSKWTSADALMEGAASGTFFENHVIMQLVRYYSTSEEAGTLSYYRDTNQKEIDLFIEREHTLHPFEIKRSASPAFHDVKKYSVIEKTALKRGYGGIICLSVELRPIDEYNAVIPCDVMG